MSDKYIKVSDFIKSVNKHPDNQYTISASQYQVLQNIAQEKVSVNDIKEIINNYSDDSYAIQDLTNLITTQPKKFGGFIITEWEQLDELPYISISVNGINGDEIMFLADYQGDYDDGIKLLPDPETMTRTNTDIPDGVRVNITTLSNDTLTYTTPMRYLNTIKHYRVLGAADE